MSCLFTPYSSIVSCAPLTRFSISNLVFSVSGKFLKGIHILRLSKIAGCEKTIPLGISKSPKSYF